MKLKCLECGFKYELEKLGSEMCPKCGCIHWSMILEDSEKLFNKPKEDSNMVILAKEFLRVVKEEGIKIVKKEGVPDDPFKYRIDKKEEGLAFVIFDIVDQKKVNVRKIYFDGHIEGFEGNPIIVNHVYPKFIRFKAVIVDMIRQINEDYMRLAERHIMADMPIAKELDCLKKAYLERINNIKI